MPIEKKRISDGEFATGIYPRIYNNEIIFYTLNHKIIKDKNISILLNFFQKFINVIMDIENFYIFFNNFNSIENIYINDSKISKNEYNYYHNFYNTYLQQIDNKINNLK